MSPFSIDAVAENKIYLTQTKFKSLLDVKSGNRISVKHIGLDVV